MHGITPWTADWLLRWRTPTSLWPAVIGFQWVFQ